MLNRSESQGAVEGFHVMRLLAGGCPKRRCRLARQARGLRTGLPVVETDDLARQQSGHHRGEEQEVEMEPIS